tara:strand:- start:867 stop:2540 length:1674 start_codon:yes stop_codon:yes gene_type:complete
MATTLEVKYFNSFWLKTVRTQFTPTAVWPNGYPYNTGTQALPLLGGGTMAAFPNGADPQNDYNWFVEEARIRGGYNNTGVDYGVKAYIVEDEPVQQHKFNSMIYSGIFNSRTGVNQTNQFSTAKDITKSLSPANGSIQKLYAENTNMTIFQESKVSSALINKDAIYSAEGSPMQTTSNVVIGQIQPYLGEYGISKNPESFAVYGFQKYFSDQDRGVVLRLSRDGITEISQYGMLDYFRDNLASLSENNVWRITAGNTTATDPGDDKTVNVATVDISKMFLGMSMLVNNNFSGYVVEKTSSGSGGGSVVIDRATYIVAGDSVVFEAKAPSKIMGGYDIHNKNYVLSLQQTPQYQDNNNYSTLAFDELINGWVGFFTYKPSQVFSVKNNLYTFQYSNLWQHYSQKVSVGSFYSVIRNSNITFIFNQDSSINKVFQTVNYEGDNGWQVDYFISEPTGYDFSSGSWRQFNDKTQNVKSYHEGEYFGPDGITYYSGFDRKENKYYANLINTSAAQPGEVVFGEQMSGIKGRFATVKFSTDATTDPGSPKELWSVGTKLNYIR